MKKHEYAACDEITISIVTQTEAVGAVGAELLRIAPT